MNTQTTGVRGAQPDAVTPAIYDEGAGIATPGVRPDGMPGSKVERQLRRLLCWRVAGSKAYMDDGEAQDEEIDFMRFTPEQIEEALKARGRIALTSAPAEPSVLIDFKQATDLLAMFGGEPNEITLQIGEGHSGRGMYASYTEMPEEGTTFLGVSDPEAFPDPAEPSPATAYLMTRPSGFAWPLMPKDVTPEWRAFCEAEGTRIEALTSAAPCGVANDDTARLEWLLPVVTGVDNPEADRRTTALGLAIMLGQSGRTAIDTARASAALA